jgi:hypothetical protein
MRNGKDGDGVLPNEETGSPIAFCLPSAAPTKSSGARDLGELHCHRQAVAIVAGA